MPRSNASSSRGGKSKPGSSSGSGKRVNKSKPKGKTLKKSADKQRDVPSKAFFRKGSAPLKKTRKPSAPSSTTQVSSGLTRLNKYIANSGICSRREADELISMGLVRVNGETITELGYKVHPGDEVRYEERVLKPEKNVYILMNKPKGYITTTKDPQERNTVMDLIGKQIKERMYPVGRLDRNTTGLLLFTNDGDLAKRLSHPSYNVKKIYKVDLDKPLTKADFTKIQEGIRLEEGIAKVDDLAILTADKKSIGIEIHVGWNRIIRRIFEALEYEVIRLDRVVFAGLDKKELPRGKWRHLKPEEIIRLKHFK
jgi:23S rRNA pseudouridine2605 synthase